MGVPFNMPQMVSQTRPIDVPAYQNVPSMGRPQAVQASAYNPQAAAFNPASVANMLGGMGGYGGGVGGSDFANGQRVN